MGDVARGILLVEDNPHDAELMLLALKRHGLADEVHTVRDGEEALEFLFGTGRFAGRDLALGPRLILLDLKLPKVDGLEVLRRLKRDDRLRLIPVVVLTSSRVERDIQEAYSLGANSYIVKPVEFERFVDAIGDVGVYWLGLNESAGPMP